MIIQDTQTFLSKPYYIVTKLLKNFRTPHFVTSAQGNNTYYCQDNIKHSNTHCIHITSMVTAPLRHSILVYSLVLRMSNSGPYWNLCGINYNQLYVISSAYLLQYFSCVCKKSLFTYLTSIYIQKANQ